MSNRNYTIRAGYAAGQCTFQCSFHCLQYVNRVTLRNEHGNVQPRPITTHFTALNSKTPRLPTQHNKALTG